MKLENFDFRIWDKHNKKYIKDFKYYNNKIFIPFEKDMREFGIDETIRSDIQVPNERVIIELYTGFVDKVGRKIFEGDIIKNEERNEFYHVYTDDLNKTFKVQAYGKNSNDILYKNGNPSNINFFKNIQPIMPMLIIGNVNENAGVLNR